VKTAEPNEELSRMWAKRHVPIVDGVMLPGGRLVSLTCSFATGPDGKQVLSVGRGDETTLGSLPQGWECEIVELAATDWTTDDGDEMRASCGEGGFGGDGWVAVTRQSDGKLLWLLFCTVSNPFVRVQVVGDLVVAESTLPSSWRIPLGDPASVEVAPAR